MRELQNLWRILGRGESVEPEALQRMLYPQVADDFVDYQFVHSTLAVGLDSGVFVQYQAYVNVDPAFPFHLEVSASLNGWIFQMQRLIPPGR